MKKITAGLLSALLVFSFAGVASAKSSKQQQDYDSYADKYPNATKRQLRNARAYDRGQYYEMDSNAHPPGSPSWWELKEREGDGRGGRRN
jgi:hypothetical protein